MTDTTVNAEITFYDSYVPSIGNGEYTITVTQRLTSDNSRVRSEPQPPLSQKFIVRGPTFGLNPADIHLVFPPPEGTGIWTDFLPMIVFNKRALPWERRMQFSVPAPERYPWLALLVFSQDELETPESGQGLGDPRSPNSQANPTRSASFPLSEVVHASWGGRPTQGPPAGTIGPTITLADDENPNEIQVNAIDISARTFANLMPTVNDLAYVAHVRQVSTVDKEPQNAVHDGWFSAIIGNRFAVPPRDQASQATNIAHLVSLEGLESYIGIDAPLTPPGPVRLISLHSWTFTSLPVPQGNLRELMLNLISVSSQQGTDLLMRLPAENAARAQSEVEKSVLEQLNKGYLPLSYNTLTGETTFAWYRGPLAPVVAERFLGALDPDSSPQPNVPLNSSEAMVYDPSAGLFDQSYAVAFQTGRSLALADLAFSMNLLQWRRDAHRTVDLLMEHTRSPHLRGILQASGIASATGVFSRPEDLSRLLDTRLVSKSFFAYLGKGFGKSVGARVGRARAAMPSHKSESAPPAAPPPPMPSDLAELTKSPAVVSLLRRLSGLEAADGAGTKLETSILPDQIVEWLGQTALLHGVPFTNLVPSARMLPEESIRFFYIDSNWTDALLDGALSVGIQSSRDSLLQRLMRDSLHGKVRSMIHQVRERRRRVRVSSAASPAAASTAASISGFVLRSAMVSGWPGLEIRAFSDTARTERIEPLRLDRVSPSVLIGIFPQVPVAIEINEPSEGLAFGRESNGVSLRYLPGTQGATQANIGKLLQPLVTLTSSELNALRRPEPAGTGALKIGGTGGLANALEAKFPGTPPRLSAASLAVEMAKVPIQMLFLPVLHGGR
jgi:hypothetical protein